MSTRLAIRILLLALSGLFAHSLMLMFGLWSKGLFLAPTGLVAGLAVGLAEGSVRQALGHPARGFWRGGVLGWGAFGLIASAVTWVSLQLALPEPSVVGVLAFAAPSIIAGAIAGGTVHALFSSSPHPTRFAARMALSFAVSAFLIVLVLRLQYPWSWGPAVATPIWTALVVRALRV